MFTVLLQVSRAHVAVGHVKMKLIREADGVAGKHLLPFRYLEAEATKSAHCDTSSNLTLQKLVCQQMTVQHDLVHLVCVCHKYYYGHSLHVSL